LSTFEDRTTVKISLSDTDIDYGNRHLRLYNPDTTDGNAAMLTFSSDFDDGVGGSQTGIPTAGIGAQFLDHVDSGSEWETDLVFWTSSGLDDPDPGVRMRIQHR